MQSGHHFYCHTDMQSDTTSSCIVIQTCCQTPLPCVDVVIQTCCPTLLQYVLSSRHAVRHHVKVYCRPQLINRRRHSIRHHSNPVTFTQVLPVVLNDKPAEDVLRFGYIMCSIPSRSDIPAQPLAAVRRQHLVRDRRYVLCTPHCQSLPSSSPVAQHHSSLTHTYCPVLCALLNPVIPRRPVEARQCPDRILLPLIAKVWIAKVEAGVRA